MILTRFFQTTLLLLSVSSASAQKGLWIIDANGSFDKTTYVANFANSTAGHPDISVYNTSLNTRIGYHISDHFLAGITGGFAINEYLFDNYGTGIDVDRVKVSNWNFGIYCRYTEWIGKRFFVYSQFSVSRYGNSIDQTYYSGYYNVPNSSSYPTYLADNGTIIDLSPVVGMSIYKGYGIHLDVGGINYSIANNSTNRTNELNFTLGQQFTFGLQKIIGWKKFQAKGSASDETKSAK